MLSRFYKSACSFCVGAGLSYSSLDYVFSQGNRQDDCHKVLIVGGGTAGTTVANQIHRKVTKHKQSRH